MFEIGYKNFFLTESQIFKEKVETTYRELV